MIRGMGHAVTLVDGTANASTTDNMPAGGLIAIAIIFIIFAAIAVSVVSYFRLLRHRSDAVAHAGYRKLAEEAVERQDQLLVELKSLELKISEIEHLLRSVG